MCGSVTLSTPTFWCNTQHRTFSSYQMETLYSPNTKSLFPQPLVSTILLSVYELGSLGDLPYCIPLPHTHLTVSVSRTRLVIFPHSCISPTPISCPRGPVTTLFLQSTRPPTLQFISSLHLTATLTAFIQADMIFCWDDNSLLTHLPHLPLLCSPEG